MSRIHFSLIAIVVLLFSLGCQEQASETQKDAGQEASAGLSNEQVVQAIESHIQSGLDSDGLYAIEDAQDGSTRNLKLDYVHTSAHEVEDGSYYACADMVDGESTLDLDFYVVEQEGETKVSKVVIHKVDGVAREVVSNKQ